MDSTNIAQVLAALSGCAAVVALVMFYRQPRGTSLELLWLGILLITAACVLLLLVAP
jgi:uncharacterized membrane protein